MQGANLPSGVGTLPAGVYTFRMLASMAGVHDPLGDTQGLDSKATLSFAAVPETGSTLLLLASGLAILMISRRMCES